jgi:uncharacterized membrane protein YdbT with pleckstrin-like domain
MAFPRRLLHDNEEVLLETRPHWSQLIVPAAAALVAIAGASTILVIWSSAPGWFGWVLLAIALIGVGYFLARLIGWRSTHLVVTSMRVIHRTGVLRRRGREIPISSVQNVEYRQSILGRLLRKGKLSVESAGAHDEEPFYDIPRPESVQATINKAIDESRRRDSVAVEGTHHDSVSDELERLGDLHRRGVITDAEFAKLKGELIEDETADHPDK